MRVCIGCPCSYHSAVIDLTQWMRTSAYCSRGFPDECVRDRRPIIMREIEERGIDAKGQSSAVSEDRTV